MLVCAMPYRHGIDTATGPVSVLSLITVYSYFIYFDVFIADVQVVGVRVDLIDLIDLFPWRVFMGERNWPWWRHRSTPVSLMHLSAVALVFFAPIFASNSIELECRPWRAPAVVARTT